jgi:hypothetical protein
VESARTLYCQQSTSGNRIFHLCEDVVQIFGLLTEVSRR